MTNPNTNTNTKNPELRRDKLNTLFTIFSPSRSKRPSDIKSNYPISDHPTKTCPFCVGNEHLCAPEVFRVPPGSGSDWIIRVIQNLYPALDRTLAGPDCPARPGVIGGFGFHDVVIETPTHPVHLPDLSPAGVGEVVLAYKRRVLEVGGFDGIKYVQVFKNHGASAGASMSHSHSQIIGLPIIPDKVTRRLAAMKDHFDETGKCILCEAPPQELIIHESTHFISIVPFAASYAFEMWIIPRFHSPHFHDIHHDQAEDLGYILKLMLKKMGLQLNNPPYNFMIHTSPLHIDESDASCSHWYLQIVPQLTVLAGFEVATGCHINPVFPEDAAQVLREVTIDIGDATDILMEANVNEIF